MNKKILSFTDLIAWKEAHILVMMTYKLSEFFPSKEVFRLTNQMRRAAISLSSNIAEGFRRNTTKDKHQFYVISQGSLTELQNQLVIARDLSYIDKKVFQDTANQTVIVNKLINGLKRIKKDTNNIYDKENNNL